jgi:phage FluMu protein Com
MLSFVLVSTSFAQNLVKDSLKGNVRQVLVSSFDSNSWSDGIIYKSEYLYDRQGVCRRIIRLRTEHPGFPHHVDTLYFTAGGIYLKKTLHYSRYGEAPEIQYTYDADEYGNFNPRPKALNGDRPYVNVMKSDAYGNWTQGSAYVDRERRFDKRNKLRTIVYYGDHPKEDSKMDELVQWIDSITPADSQPEITASYLDRACLALSKAGFWGYLVLFIIVPALIVALTIWLPLSLLTLIRQIPNFLLWILALILGRRYTFIAIDIIDSSPPYDGFLGSVAIWGITLVMAMGVAYGIISVRCPKCRYSNSSVWRTITTTFRTKEYKIHSNREKELMSSSSHKFVDEDHVCHNCGYKWRTQEPLNF